MTGIGTARGTGDGDAPDGGALARAALDHDALDHDALAAFLVGEGFRRVEPTVLQPAEPFLDLSGEDMRRRMIMVQDAAGAERCLRPEYTIPVCRLHLAGGASVPAAYSYCGPVFRLRPGETGEFLQAGVESIGRADAAAADAEIIGLASEGLERLGLPAPDWRLGDMGLLDALVDALGVPPALKRRILRSIASGGGLRALQGAEEAPAPAHAGLLKALEGQDAGAAKAFVEDVLSIAGIATVGGRSAGAIAERFLARAANRSGALPEETLAVLERYLAITGDLDEAARLARAVAVEAGLASDPALDAALTAFEERTGFMAARGLDLARFAFAADFARNLDYYTGFIFEARAAGGPSGKPLVGGGRYDRLLAHLGSPEPLPAVGCSFWLDRIGAALTPSEGPAHG